MRKKYRILIIVTLIFSINFNCNKVWSLIFKNNKIEIESLPCDGYLIDNDDPETISEANIQRLEKCIIENGTYKIRVLEYIVEKSRENNSKYIKFIKSFKNIFIKILHESKNIKEINNALYYFGYTRNNEVLKEIQELIENPYNDDIAFTAIWAENVILNKINLNELPCDTKYYKRINSNFELKTCEIWNDNLTSGEKYKLIYREKYIDEISTYYEIDDSRIIYRKMGSKSQGNEGEILQSRESYIYFNNFQKNAINKIAKYFNDHFSVPEFIENKIYYWGIKKNPENDNFSIYAAFYDVSNNENKLQILCSDDIATNSPIYFGWPYEREGRIYYLFARSGWILSKNLQIESKLEWKN